MAIATTITITAIVYDVYGITSDPVQDATDYLAAKLGSTWATATTLQQQQAIITATRMLDRAVTWDGTKTVSTQALQWPRDGVTNQCTTSAVTDGTVPDSVAGYLQTLPERQEGEGRQRRSRVLQPDDRDQQRPATAAGRERSGEVLHRIHRHVRRKLRDNHGRRRNILPRR